MFWISKADGLLLKYEFGTDDLQKKFNVPRCDLWAEFNGARINRPIADNAFVFAVPDGAKQLKRLLPPPPVAPAPMLGKKPEAFTFVDLEGRSVNRDSLKNKVVVLDMWATWCGWCFKGLPNLEQVYDRYRDNKQVVILAVNKDEAAVSDANVSESFAKAQLSIPIVRDPSRLDRQSVRRADAAHDGRVGHRWQCAGVSRRLRGNAGRDAARQDRKTAGRRNLAEDTLEKYRQAQAEYDQQLSDALADGQATGNNDVARKPGKTQSRPLRPPSGESIFAPACAPRDNLAGLSVDYRLHASRRGALRWA